MNISQPAPTIWTTLQLGLFCLISPLQCGRLPPGKLPLPGFASRLLRVFHPFPTCKWRRLAFPARCNSSTCACKRSNSFCSLRLLTCSLWLVARFSYQFQLQFSDPLIFRTGLGVLIPFAAHPTKFTASRSFGQSHSASVFLRFDPTQIMTLTLNMYNLNLEHIF